MKYKDCAWAKIPVVAAWVLVLMRRAQAQPDPIREYVQTYTPPPCDPTKITVDKAPPSAGGTAVYGANWAALPNATVMVSDGVNSRTTTANNDGSFFVGVAGLMAGLCDFLLVRQRVYSQGNWSQAVPIHSDPPGEEFATPDWESIFAGYLLRTHAVDFLLDGVRVLVRPQAPRITALISGEELWLVGSPGAVNQNALLIVGSADCHQGTAVADESGPFRLTLRRETSRCFLVRQSFHGRRSRSVPIWVEG